MSEADAKLGAAIRRMVEANGAVMVERMADRFECAIPTDHDPNDCVLWDISFCAATLDAVVEECAAAAMAKGGTNA